MDEMFSYAEGQLKAYAPLKSLRTGHNWDYFEVLNEFKRHRDLELPPAQKEFHSM